MQDRQEHSSDPGPKTTDEWFNTAAFTNQAFFDASGKPIFLSRFGNAEKGSITGPGFYVLDMGLFKDFTLGRGMRLRAQIQAQNVTNHPNLGLPDTNLTSPNYGRITSLAASGTTSGSSVLGSRVVVIGARLMF
jgi:hypothetical protein